MIAPLSCILFLFFAAVLASSSAVKKPEDTPQLQFYRIQGPFKVSRGKSETETEFTISLPESKGTSQSILLSLSPTNTLNINRNSISQQKCSIYQLDLATENDDSAKWSFDPLPTDQNPFSAAAKSATLFLIMYSESPDLSAKVLVPFSFKRSKYMGTCARTAIDAFKGQNDLKDISFGFFLLNEADSQLENPLWATIFIVVIVILDLAFIVGFCVWCYWINQAKKLKDEK